MALSETNITEVLLTQTFEDWRVTTNQLITVINESTDTNPTTALVSADSLGTISINTVISNTISSDEITGNKLDFSSSTSNVTFLSANVASLGNVHQIFLDGGDRITGATPDSKIENVQLNHSEINLNGATLRANGASTIDLSGATVDDLGTVNQFRLNFGEMYGSNIYMTSNYTGKLTITDGTHTLTSATFEGGYFEPQEIRNTSIHSSELTVNTNSTIVSNTGMIIGTDVTNANVGIGYFPEWDGVTRTATTSSGRVHIRSGSANTGAGLLESLLTQTDVAARFINGDELILENSDNVGMTLLSNSSKNSHIFFGDEADVDQGYIKYVNSSDVIEFSAGSSNPKARILTNHGGSLQVAGANAFATLSGKLHVHQATTDDIVGVYLNAARGNKSAATIVSGQTTSNSFNLNTETLTDGNLLDLRYNNLSDGGGTDAAFTGSMLHVRDENTSTNLRKLINIEQARSEAIGTTALYMNMRAGKGIDINQDSDNFSINIESDNTTKNTFNIVSDGITTGSILHISTLSSHSSNLVSFVSDAPDAVGTTLYVRNDSVSAATKMLEVANASASLITVETGGSIGINKSNPEYQLDVVGLTKFTGNVYIDTQPTEYEDGNVKIDGDVYIKGGEHTYLAVDGSNFGSAILGVGENAENQRGGAYYISYNNAVEGYVYLGTGEIDDTTRIPQFYSMRLYYNNSDVYSPSSWEILGNVDITSNVSIGGNTAMGHDVTVSNNFTVGLNNGTYQTITLWGDLKAKHDVDVTRNLKVTGAFTATGGASVSGGMSLSGDTTVTGNLNVTGNTNIDKNLDVTKSAVIDQNLTVTGNTQLTGKVVASNTFALTGLATFANTITVNGSTTYLGPVSKEHEVFIRGNTVIDKEITVTGNSSISGFITSTTYDSVDQNGVGITVTAFDIVSNTDITGAVTVSSKADITGNLYVAGANTWLAGNAFIRTNLDVSGNTIIRQNATVNKDLTVLQKVTATQNVKSSQWLISTKSANVGDNLFVFNNTTIGTQAKANSEFKVWGNGTITGTLNVNNGNITGGVDLDVTGNTDIGGDLQVDGDASVGTSGATSTLTVYGNTTITGTLDVNGSSITASENLSVTGNTDIGGLLQVDDDVTIGTSGDTANITVWGAGTYKTTLDVLANTSIGGNLIVTGNTEVTGTTNYKANVQIGTSSSKQTLIVYGKLNSYDDITTTGEVNANGVKCRLIVYDTDGTTILNAA
jgi:carbonic anhydrase/acetyltransferase-like protein (isoleucine patch superfamily)